MEGGGEEREVEVEENSRDKEEGGGDVNRGKRRRKESVSVRCLTYNLPHAIILCCYYSVADPPWFSSLTAVSLSHIYIGKHITHTQTHKLIHVSEMHINLRGVFEHKKHFRVLYITHIHA